MQRLPDLPDLVIVRALTDGGPYAEGNTISVAFTNPNVGRLRAHEIDPIADMSDGGDTVLPETISGLVLRGAGPYANGDVITLSFIDPRIARIHAAGTNHVPPDANPSARSDLSPQAALKPLEAASPANTRLGEANVSQLPARTTNDGELVSDDVVGVRTSLTWSEERTRRFVQVTDKLFTIDRLGWYRHAFAMRLLIPDDISCGDASVDSDVAHSLRALRGAALETLGRPLIAAFMPNFMVTPEWLDTLDSVEAARSLGALRTMIAPFAIDDPKPRRANDPSRTIGVLTGNDLRSTPSTSVEANLPLLIASDSVHDDVTDRLRSYRQALIELFSGTARAAETVRLTQMAQPNHTLDDRLWQLVGAVSERFGGLAVA